MLQQVWWLEHEEPDCDGMYTAVETMLQDSYLKYEQSLGTVSHRANTSLHTG